MVFWWLVCPYFAIQDSAADLLSHQTAPFAPSVNYSRLFELSIGQFSSSSPFVGFLYPLADYQFGR
jgi:hypothetical protein